MVVANMSGKNVWIKKRPGLPSRTDRVSDACILAYLKLKRYYIF
jgi:hypothetical protein